MLIPPRLKPGDKVRFVSPASTPDREQVMRRAKILEEWGLRVDFGEHAFDKLSFLAGTDEDRLADFNAALNDPDVRAIFATRGGKGSYRIADRLDFERSGAIRNSSSGSATSPRCISASIRQLRAGRHPRLRYGRRRRLHPDGNELLRHM